MQRVRITGIYLAGVMTILAAAVWGVSLRESSELHGAAMTHARPLSAASQPYQSSGAGPNPSPDTVPTEAGAAVKVSIDNFAFVPEELTVTAGTTVTWVNNDDVPHTASSTAKPSVFDSRALDTDEKYSFQFKTRGSYEYYCKVHPHMIGRIIVK